MTFYHKATIGYSVISIGVAAIETEEQTYIAKLVYTRHILFSIGSILKV